MFATRLRAVAGGAACAMLFAGAASAQASDTITLNCVGTERKLNSNAKTVFRVQLYLDLSKQTFCSQTCGTVSRILAVSDALIDLSDPPAPPPGPDDYIGPGVSRTWVYNRRSGKFSGRRIVNGATLNHYVSRGTCTVEPLVAEPIIRFLRSPPSP